MYSCFPLLRHFLFELQSFYLTTARPSSQLFIRRHGLECQFAELQPVKGQNLDFHGQILCMQMSDVVVSLKWSFPFSFQLSGVGWFMISTKTLLWSRDLTPHTIILYFNHGSFLYLIIPLCCICEQISGRTGTLTLARYRLMPLGSVNIPAKKKAMSSDSSWRRQCSIFYLFIFFPASEPPEAKMIAKWLAVLKDNK